MIYSKAVMIIMGFTSFLPILILDRFLLYFL